MGQFVIYSKRDNVGILLVDNPPVNALSHGVRAGLVECLAKAEKDDVQAIVLACAGRTFIAGADISEFGKPPKEPNLNVAIEGMEGSSKPIVAAIHGTALGGGLEIAMCCHYRVAVPTAKLGQPEVKLGIIPGAGGTQRLPRVVGVEKALEMIAIGDPIDAEEAHKLGLVDEVIRGDLLDGAVAFAKKVVAEKRPLVKISDKNDTIKNVDPAVFQKWRAELKRTRRGFEAPQACVDAVEAATKLPFKEGLAKEREIFMKLVTSEQSRAQRHIFFAERAAGKVEGLPKDTPVREIKSVAILGAGTMGGGIAMNFANAGVPVRILDTTQEQLDKGLGVVRKNYERTASKGRITMQDVENRMGLIQPVLSYDEIKDVDMVIEAVFEEMDIKKDVFRKLDKTCRPDCILATNTSTLDVNEIASVTSRPQQVIGTHFFSPANVMRLLEVVRGAKTSNEVLATTMAVAKTIGKVAVVVGVCDGFVGNRMIHGYSREAGFLLEEGALPQDVDRALYDFGLAMGPFQMGDLAGLDVGWRIRKRQGVPQGKRYSRIADLLCEEGRYGQKTGKGWYLYEGGDRTPKPDPHVEEIIVKESERLGIKRRKISDQEIIERCLYALVNEGAKILEEKIAQRASDIDVIYVNGYGFPVYRGGPMFWADTVGLKKVYERVAAFHKEHGDYWTPAPLLQQLAEAGKTFNEPV